jgi:hypothetical protein
MFGFCIANLIVPEREFEIPSAFGTWSFRRSHSDDQLCEAIERGACGNTFLSQIQVNIRERTDIEFQALCDEIISACLLLSWLTARCVTVTQTLPNCEVQFLTLGDHFLPARGIVGFPRVNRTGSLTQFFQPGLPHFQNIMRQRRLNLMLCHWLSGLTCFTLEDIFLNACVQMDVVKQCEMTATGRRLDFLHGMIEASTRYNVPQLSVDYRNMRNDLVHEGVLSGTNNPHKTKAQCQGYAADTLNWIDRYIGEVLGIGTIVGASPRWSGQQIMLPSFL